MTTKMKLDGARHEISIKDMGFPETLRSIPLPPKELYAIGSMEALSAEGVAIVGARKATPYGRERAGRFAAMLTERGITLVTGGARGCDTAALKGCMERNGRAVVFLGGGCDAVYPSENANLFQRIIDNGGAVVSEHPWDATPLPYKFRARNRLIAGLSKAVFVIEAGLPSGTFSTADEALAASKEVFALPGPITSQQSRGVNRLIYQGATPIVDDETFTDQLFALFGQNA